MEFGYTNRRSCAEHVAECVVARKLKKIFSKKSEKFFFEQPGKLGLLFLYTCVRTTPHPPRGGVCTTRNETPVQLCAKAHS